MANESSLLRPRFLRIAAVGVAISGLFFVFFQDTWMIAAVVLLSGGLMLLSYGEEEDDPRQRRYGYIGLALAAVAMLVDLVLALARLGT